MWMTYYDIDRSLGQKAAEVVGVRTRGFNMMVGLTSSGRLVIGNNERDEAPRSYERGQVTVSEHAKTAEIGSLAGPNGMEPAHVMLIAPAQGEPFRLQIARSGLAAVAAWSRGA